MLAFHYSIFGKLANAIGFIYYFALGEKTLHFQDTSLYTPLHIAAATIRVNDLRKIELCRFLLSEGAVKDLENKHRHTATDFQFWMNNKSAIEM